MTGGKKTTYQPKIRVVPSGQLIKKVNQEKISLKKKRGCGCGQRLM